MKGCLDCPDVTTCTFIIAMAKGEENDIEVMFKIPTIIPDECPQIQATIQKMERKFKEGAYPVLMGTPPTKKQEGD